MPDLVKMEFLPYKKNMAEHISKPTTPETFSGASKGVSTDIRDQSHLPGEALATLNFLQTPDQYIFRKYYRFGLRSHIFEILLKKDVIKAQRGEMIDGIRCFPRALPIRMLRILRNRFNTIDQVFKEIKKYKILYRYLGPDLIACSEEFIVDYTGTGVHQMVLCGLQEFVQGEILDPWKIYTENYLNDMYRFLSSEKAISDASLKAREQIKKFVGGIHCMIRESGFIPDLAGTGNLILTPGGGIKLVDINNIVPLSFEDQIPIDDKGYPACDISVEVLSIIEHKLLGCAETKKDPIYRHFLNDRRRENVKVLEKQFYKSFQAK